MILVLDIMFLAMHLFTNKYVHLLMTAVKIDGF
jgi:hypothetical protein